jgi:hypothetical protein
MWEDYEAYLQNNILDDVDFDEDVEIEDDLYQWHEFDEINTEWIQVREYSCGM